MIDDVVIVGAGVMGLLAARRLMSQGKSVRLLDAGRSLPCASWAAGGILSPLFPWRYDEAVSQLTDSAVSSYRALEAELLAEGVASIEVNICGMLVLEDKDAKSALAWCGRHGFDVEQKRAGAVQPGLSPALAEQQALWLPQLGSVRNSRLLSALELSLRKRHVPLTQTRVLCLEPVANGWRVLSEQGSFLCRQLLVAAGAWSAGLLKPLGVTLPVRPVKGQMALFQAPVGALRTLLLGEGCYLIPRLDGRVLVGSTLEPDATDMLPDENGQQALLARWQRFWPQHLEARQLLHWAGWRPGNDSDIPFIGAVPGHEGLFVCTGHYRNGICAAPASITLLVTQMCGLPPPFSGSPYAVPSASS